MKVNGKISHGTCTEHFDSSTCSLLRTGFDEVFEMTVSPINEGFIARFEMADKDAARNRSCKGLMWIPDYFPRG
ncbi:MAG: hypothetical protein ACRENZ_07160 [Thermodesulfobacteriota bacterium]